MKQIANFFTLYWCIYFPTCIAYNDLPGFSSIDEVMTGILILYTISMKGQRSTNNYVWKEYFQFWGILLFYIVYSLITVYNVVNAIWYDLMQQIRPWSVIYCTWILNPQFSKRQKKWMVGTMAATVVTFLFYHPEVTSNISGSASRNAPFGQLAICTSMAWYLLTEEKQKNIMIATLIAITGLLGMKFKYYGQFGAWMFMLFIMKKKFTFKGGSIYWQVGILLAIVIFLGWDRLNAYYIEGASNEELARPMINKAMMQMLWDYFPFGTGLGTFATAASAVYYSPLWKEYGLSHMWGLNFGGSVGFHCDSFFGSFAQIGIVGIIFFYIFWKRRFKEFSAIEDMKYYKVAMMAFFCVAIEWTGDQSFFSGKGMGYMMIMGLCLNANRNMKNDENENEDEEEREVSDERLEMKDGKNGMLHLRDDYWEYHKKTAGNGEDKK